MSEQRGKQNIPVKSMLNILCEGQTEECYIEGYKQERFKSVKPRVEIHPAQKNTAVSLVEEAIELKKGKRKRASPNDKWWVVYDREGLQDYKDKLHKKALDKAKKNNICVAISSVCVEVWLLLHFCESTAQYTSCDDLLKNSKLKDHLRKLGIEEHKKDKDLYRKITSHNCDAVKKARERAIRMNENTKKTSPRDHCQTYQYNPYTQMHLLLDAIDAVAAE